MKSLEHKIPPPVVALLFGLAIWLLARYTPVLVLPRLLSTGAAIVIAAIGIGFAMAGAGAFRRAKTTTNPLKPETATTLVISGVYRLTRNPMYVGLLLIIIAWAWFLATPAGLIITPAYVWYITAFQIRPEETALLQKFGADYAQYLTKVRRWL